MKRFLNKFNLPFKNYIIASFLINLVIILSILVLGKFILPPEVPLFYGLPQGQDQIADSLLLIIPSIVSVVIIVTNSFLAYITKDSFIKKSLILAGVLSVLFPLATTLKIIFLIGSF